MQILTTCGSVSRSNQFQYMPISVRSAICRGRFMGLTSIKCMVNLAHVSTQTVSVCSRFDAKDWFFNGFRLEPNWHNSFFFLAENWWPCYDVQYYYAWFYAPYVISAFHLRLWYAFLHNVNGSVFCWIMGGQSLE